MKDIGGLMKQAQKMQEDLKKAQAEIELLEATGAAGAGLVSVTLNGKSEMRSVKIDPSLADPAEMEVLEDLVVAAYNEAKRKVDEEVKKKMGEAAGGLGALLPPGMKFPF